MSSVIVLACLLVCGVLGGCAGPLRLGQLPTDEERCVDGGGGVYVGPSPSGGPVAHPTLVANQALRLRHSRYVVHAGLHAKMQFEFLEPIRAGMRVRSRGRVVDKYERRGKQYMVTEFVTEDDAGTTLVRGQFTQMLIPA